MTGSVIATRYARALSGAIRSNEEFERVATELRTLAELLGSDPHLRAALEHPGFPKARRAELLGEVGRALGLGDKTRRLLELLEERGRLGAIQDISQAFAEQRDEREGIVEAELTTAVALDEPLSRRWAEALGRLTGRTIRLKQRVDPGLIGGAVARIGSTVYDGSVRNRMLNLRQVLTRR